MNATTIKDNQAADLLSSYIDGDDGAFEALYDMYAQMLLNYGSCLTTDKELVKDCVHDVFIKLLDRNHGKSIKHVTSYLIISLRNKLVDAFRRNSFLSDAMVEDYRNVIYAPDVEHTYVDQEQSRLQGEFVNRLLGTLTPRQKEAFKLYYMEEKPYDEICRIMQMNYHSVRNLVHRGMLRLRAAAM